MSGAWLLVPILVPVIAGIEVLFAPRKKYEGAVASFSVLATVLTLAVAIWLFGKECTLTLAGSYFGVEFSLRLYQFSSFILLASAGFGVAISFYSLSFMNGKNLLSQYYAYFLITLGFVNGAVLADNLIILLFFWEGLLLTLFGLIAIGHKGAFPTAVKAFVISGVADLCMMAGVALTIHLAGTATISAIHLPMSKLASLAFLLLAIGATAKAGSMPFHSWIPDAAVDAPLPFMALVPAASRNCSASTSSPGSRSTCSRWKPTRGCPRPS